MLFSNRSGGLLSSALASTTIALGCAVALLLSGGVVSASAAGSADSLSAPALLRVDGQGSDALLGTTTPTFSWAPQDSGRGQSQTAYQVRVSRLVADTGDERTIVWDSDKVISSASTAVDYAGNALAPDSTYEWSVRTWNEGDHESVWSKPQQFDVGPMSATDWHTDWLRVGEGDLARTEIELARPVARARLYVGAQGIIETHLNGAIVDPDRVYDSSATDYTERVVYRSFDVTDQLVPGTNVLGALLAAGSYNDSPTFIAQLSVTYDDGSDAVFGTDDSWTTAPGAVTGSDFYYGEAYDARLEEDGWDSAGFDAGDWTPVPIFSPAVGLVDLALGGAVTGSDPLLANGWSPAALVDGIRVSTASSQGYHSQLAPSADTSKWVQVDLGSSMDIGSVALFPANPTNDTTPYPAAGFPVRYQVQVSNDPAFATFDVLADRSASDQASPGLTPVSINGDATGRYVRVAASKLNCRAGNCTLRFAELGVYPASGTPVFGYTALEPDTTPPVRVVDTLAPKSQASPATGVTVYDFGQVYVGQVEISGSAPTGATVTITKGELLKAGRVSTSNISFSDAEPTRQNDSYTFAGTGTETWHPSLNYAGFRFAEVSGVPAGTTLTVTARVSNNDVAQTGSFSTSSPLLNQIQDAVVRTQLNNLQQGMPLDCPTREKHGWLGDAGDTNVEAMANFDMQSFYDKWLGDVRTSQNSNGSVSSIAPVQGRQNEFVPEPAWGSAYPQIVWDAYVEYGDQDVLETNYDEVRAWVDWMATISTGGVINENTHSWGDDWQATQSTPHVYFQTAFYIYDAQLLAKMATELGNTSDAAKYSALASNLADSFNAKYFTAATDVYGTGTQLSYAFPLFLGIVPAGHEDAVLAKLVKDIRDRGNHVSTGYAGTTIVYQALSLHDRNDVLLDVAERTDFPSFGYMVTSGPGTIWEKWTNSSAADGTSSKSHIGLAGSIGQWYYQQLAGIQPGAAGWTEFTLAPAIVGDLTHVEASQRTVRGTIASSWSREGGDLTYEATIPVGSTATVELPATSVRAVSEGGDPLDEATGISGVIRSGDLVTFTAASGSYEFHVSADAEAAVAARDAADALSAHVSSLESTGNLTADASATLRSSLGDVSDALSDALSLLQSDSGAAAQKVLVALAAAREASDTVASDEVSDAARTALSAETNSLVAAVQKLATSLSGVSTTVDLGEVASFLPGETVTAEVTLANRGEVAVSGLEVSLDLPDGWTGPASTRVESLPAGESTTVTLVAEVPDDELPGEPRLSAGVAFDFAGTRLTTTTPIAVTIGSTAEVASVTIAPDSATPTSAATATVTVRNTGEHTLTGAVALDLPDGWVAPLPSPVVRIASGASEAVPVRFFVPTTLSEEVISLDATFVRAGTVLASRPATLEVTVPTPATSLDHVDFGNGGSESSHQLVSSGDGGTGSEGGLTRRYSGSPANAYFGVTMAVPANAPFVLTAIETFDGARLKEYTVTVNGVLVQSRLFQRKVSGNGLGAYQLLVDNPAAFSANGKAAIRFTHGANTNYDPSLADVWTSAAPTDLPAPSVQAEVSPAPDGSRGWHISAPTVTITGQDFAGELLTDLETRETGEFVDYTSPVVVTGQGEHTLDYRGSSDGVTSAVGTVKVKRDSVAPLSSGSVSGTATARVTIVASDETSGVQATEYRVGDGEWTAYSAPVMVDATPEEQTVSFRSTDAAGNVEQTRSLVVPAAETPPTATAPVVTTNPVKSVSAVAGKKVTLSAAARGVPAPTVRWQSSADGKTWKNITGAVSTKYSFTAKASQSGTRVRALFANSAASVATSSTKLVVKTATSVNVAVKDTSITKKQHARVTITVSPVAKKATGTITLRYGSKTKKITLKSSQKGRIVVELPKLKKGKYTITAIYSGNSTLAPDASSRVTIRVR